MKYKSRKDLFFSSVIYGLILFLVVLSISMVVFETEDPTSLFVGVFCIMGVIGVLLWMYNGTYYIITATNLVYVCGPLRGSIAIESIKEIIVGKTLWVGVRPATAKNGLIVKFNRYDEIYISPVNQKEFVEKLVELNPSIVLS